MQGDFMKLFYSPHYTGHVYTGLENAENGILFDTETVSTQGLLDRIKLHAGLRRRIKPQGERFVAYYKAMSAYMKDTRDSIFRESFNTDPLKTAEQCLAWRDALAAAGWNAGTQAQSARLTALQGIEKHFTGGKDGKKENISLAEEIFEITEEIKKGCSLPAGLEIQMPFEPDILPPAERGLLEALQEKGAEIKIMPCRENKNTNLDKITALLEGKNAEKEITLAENDGTFKIWHFADRTESMKYLSTLPADSFSTWINENNQELDSWLKLAGKPVAGSNISGLPQIAQLLVIGISLFSRPLNIYRLMDWLNMPSSPLPEYLRSRLSAEIAAQGGYYNPECKKIIEEFLNYDYSDKDIEEKERKEKIKKNEERVNNFLNFFENSQKEKNYIEISKLKIFIENLKLWCIRQVNLNTNIDPHEKAQLAAVKEQCAAMLAILPDGTSGTIEYKKIESMLGSINSAVEMTLYNAESGCRNAIDSSGKLAAISPKTIWCGFYDKPEEKLRYSFLYEEEKTELKSLNFWEEKNERKFNRILMLMPFMYSENLVLAIADKNGTENTKKHPVIIRLENQIKKESFKELVIEHKGQEITKTEEKDIIDNRLAADASSFEIDKGIIKPRQKESATSLEMLIQNPMDYVFKYMAKIKPEGIAAINDIDPTKGTVAHAVIKAIFEPSENEPKGTREYINANFETIFNKQLEQCGAILLLPENYFEKELLRTQLKECLGLLIKTFEKNNLKVKYCEKEYSQENFLETASAKGIADMVLEDKDGNIYLFDFKWSGKENKYSDLIKENRSVQLALYSSLIKKTENKGVKAAAYVLLPKTTVITCGGNLQGNNVIHINDSKSMEDVFETVKNSYKYRMEQLKQGIVEMADGLADFAYLNDTENKNLVPLETEEIKTDNGKQAVKKQNTYSDYLCFKAIKGEAK